MVGGGAQEPALTGGSSPLSLSTAPKSGFMQRRNWENYLCVPIGAEKGIGSGATAVGVEGKKLQGWRCETSRLAWRVGPCADCGCGCGCGEIISPPKARSSCLLRPSDDDISFSFPPDTFCLGPLILTHIRMATVLAVGVGVAAAAFFVRFKATTDRILRC